jgi:hypothetical protein
LIGAFNFMVRTFHSARLKRSSRADGWYIVLQSYIDRSNIGFAATQGMIEDLNLKGNELNVSTTIRWLSEIYLFSNMPLRSPYPSSMSSMCYQRYLRLAVLEREL